jgi:hypothetical protein
MSKEEMQFADPEWQPPGQLNSTLEQEELHPQSINYTREEHQASLGSQHGESEDESDYFTGYTARQQQHFASPPKQRKHRRASRWFWVFFILIILTFFAARPIFLEGGYLVEGFVFENLIFGLGVLALIIAVIAIFRGRSRLTFRNSSTVETRDFLVGNRSTIIVNNNCGAIRVLSSAERNQVRIQATKKSKGWGHVSNDLQVHYNHRTEDNTIVVESIHRWSIFGKNNVDYEISVPLITDLELKTDVGRIDVSNVNGQMRLFSDAGSIHATHVSLQGKSKLKTDLGSINFSGSIKPQGTYQFFSDAGSINLSLPEDASFEVDARTDVGSIRCNFPIHGHSKKSHSKLKGKVGNPPHAALTLKTDVGSITLKQA